MDSQDILGVLPRPVHRPAVSVRQRHDGRGRRAPDRICLCVPPQPLRLPLRRQLQPRVRQRARAVLEDQEDVFREQDRIRRERIAARVKARGSARTRGEAEDVAEDDEGATTPAPDLESGGGDRTTDRTTSPRGEDEGTGGCWAPRAARATPATSRPRRFRRRRQRRTPGGPVLQTLQGVAGVTTKHCHDCGRCVRSSITTASGWKRASGEESRAVRGHLVAQTALIVWAFHVATADGSTRTRSTSCSRSTPGRCACPSRSSSSPCSSVRCWASRVPHRHQPDDVGG